MKKIFLKASTILAILVIAIVFIGCASLNNSKQPDNNADPGKNDEQTVLKEITLYFGNQQAEYLVPERRQIEIKKDASAELLAESIIAELVKGPEEKNLSPTIPEQVKVLSVDIRENTAYVDFSEEIKTRHWGGSAGETMTITSIVNSLTELDEIDKVQILIAGEEQDTLAGHWDISQPLERDEDIIKK
ncbi:MAG: GerMN domain-containing protein [Syntrophomonadaceae bacterium]|nr:GerMN domain-containing protein [Syntrophomonadaceae bacterium]